MRAMVVGVLLIVGVLFAAAAIVAVTVPFATFGDPMLDHMSAGPSGPAGADAPTPAAIATLEPDIAYAISQRQQFGLRSDEAWVRAVAADPRARINLLDFPMLPEEEAAFSARTDSYDTVAAAVDAYAAGHQDEFGGVWIDQPHHTVVAAWTANAELHRLAILATLGGQGALAGRTVRYPEAQLRALQDRVFEDSAWMTDIPALITMASVDIMANTTEVGISSANPAAPALILAHYGVPADMLRVTSDGTGILLQPRGTIEGLVVTADGKAPPANPFLSLDWTADRPGGGDCGNMTGQSPADDGTFTLPCAPGGWTITVSAIDGDNWKVIGSGHVVVPPGGTVSLRITLDPAASSEP